MNLPNRQQAYIPRAKLTAYLLSETHAVGKSKAKFFRTLGFEETTIDLLEQRLVRIAQIEPITETVYHRSMGPNMLLRVIYKLSRVRRDGFEPFGLSN